MRVRGQRRGTKASLLSAQRPSWTIRVPKYPRPLFKKQTSRGPASRATWTQIRSRRGELSRLGPARRPQGLITGGDFRDRARRGYRLCAQGRQVAINYFPSEEPDASEGVKAFWRKLVGEAVATLGGLDILVCNASRQQARQRPRHQEYPGQRRGAGTGLDAAPDQCGRPTEVREVRQHDRVRPSRAVGRTWVDLRPARSR
jgi:hypothetical protein